MSIFYELYIALGGKSGRALTFSPSDVLAIVKSSNVGSTISNGEDIL